MAEAVGQHFLIEMYDCDEQLLDDPAVIEAAMLSTANCCGTTVIHHFFHRFRPHGISGIVVIAESHMSIHTWPEYGYAAVDFFTCGARGLPDACLDFLRQSLKCARLSHKKIARGEDLMEARRDQIQPAKIIME